MHFQWYPGHMTKARRMMQENIKLIDLIIELVDARVPLSSRNPDIDELGKNKARLILLNKADLAEDRRNDEWMEYFKKQGYSVVKVNSKKGGGIKSIQSVIQEACKEKMERDRKRGILNRPVRAMVVGIPNVGKSTFINALAGKACAKTGNKPGVTKGKQWIRLNKNVELLDTSQGVQAQTISNLYMALEHDLEIIPVLNKCDMASAMPDEVEDEIIDLLGCKHEDIIRASGKTGMGVEEILKAVVERIPHPTGDEEAPLQALIFDSVFNSFRGIIA